MDRREFFTQGMALATLGTIGLRSGGVVAATRREVVRDEAGRLDPVRAQVFLADLRGRAARIQGTIQQRFLDAIAALPGDAAPGVPMEPMVQAASEGLAGAFLISAMADHAVVVQAHPGVQRLIQAAAASFHRSVQALMGVFAKVTQWERIDGEARRRPEWVAALLGGMEADFRGEGLSELGVRRFRQVTRWTWRRLQRRNVSQTVAWSDAGWTRFNEAVGAGAMEPPAASAEMQNEVLAARGEWAAAGVPEEISDKTPLAVAFGVGLLVCLVCYLITPALCESGAIFWGLVTLLLGIIAGALAIAALFAAIFS